MSVPYLNASRQEELIKVACIGDLLEREIEIYSNDKHASKDFMKYLRTAKTFADKALKDYISQIDINTVESITRRIKQLEMNLAYKTSVPKTTEPTITMSEAVLLGIVEQAMAVCNWDCNRTKEHAAECKIRKFYSQYPEIIPPLVEDPGDLCQFQLDSETANVKEKE